MIGPDTYSKGTVIWMITVYGSLLCKDCMAMKIVFEKLHVDYRLINITGKSVDLHAFIVMRDQDIFFQPIRESGKVGIPFFTKGNLKSFDINEALSWEGFEPISEVELERITEECILLCK